MKNKLHVNILLILLLVTNILGNEEDPQATLNSTDDNLESHFNDHDDQEFSSSAVSEKVPDSIGMPQTSEPKPRPHQKHKNPTDSIRSHNRSPVYEVINQPCYSPGCSGYGPQDGFMGSRWQPGRNRFGPYPKYYEPRRRGGYREFLPSPGYGPNYGPAPYPDYGYGPGPGPRPMNPRDRFGGYGRQVFEGGYNRPPYDDYFLG